MVHFVISDPGFRPEDVVLTEEESDAPGSFVRQIDDIEGAVAMDGALVKEVLVRKDSENVGIAVGELSPRRSAVPHYHKVSEELYYVQSGKGFATVGGRRFEVSSGDAVYVPTNMMHALENAGDGPMRVVCISSPAYADSDFIRA